MSCVAIVGAGGFIGAQVAHRFVRAGWRVLAGCRADTDPARLAALGDAVTRVEIDLYAIARSPVWDMRPDLVVNCAGYGVNPREADPALAARINALAPVELAAACGDGRRILHLGSAAEYRHTPDPIAETGCTVTAGLYGGSKLAGTLAILQAGIAWRRDVCVVRPFGCYGEGESAGKLLPTLLAALRANQPVALTSGEQVRDYIHVGDLAEALLRLATAEGGTAGEIFNACSGVPITIRRLGEALLARAGATPELARWGALPQRAHDPGWLVGDATKLRRATGWAPGIDLATGMGTLL